MRKVLSFGALYLGLTALGLAWALGRSPLGWADLREASKLPGTWVFLIALLSVILFWTEAFRYRAYAAAVGVRLGWAVSLETAVQNFFFSWISPGGLLGAPATVYLLGKRGVPIDAGIILAFGKSLTGVAFLLLAALVTAFLQPVPDLRQPWVYGALLAGIGIYLSLLVLPILGGLFPVFALRLARRGERWAGKRNQFLRKIFSVFRESVERMRQLLGSGWRAWGWIFLSQAVYYVVFVGILVALIRAFSANSNLLGAVGSSILYLGLSIISPTPGGSGVGEVTAQVFFGALVPGGKAILVAVIFRAFTFHLQLVVGAAWVLIRRSLWLNP